MKDMSECWRARLRNPATTLAQAWRLTRTDGVVLGFTDHDEDLEFAGTVFAARTGWTAGEADAALGLGAGTHGIEAALSATAIREEDIAAGLYDAATVEIFRVDWESPEDHLLVDVADFGEVSRTDAGLTVELRGLAARLDRQHGRYYRRRCDAVLGDERCRVDLAPWTRTGWISAIRDDGISVDGLGALKTEFFSGGRMRVGAGPWREISDIRRDEADGGTVHVTLVEPVLPSWTAGEGVSLLAGCDRSFATCRGRFDNALNFRGFPHIPGADAALGVAKSDGRHDGSAVVP